MGFTNQERQNLDTKVLAASTKDANSVGQWYESRFFAGVVEDGRQVWAQFAELEANPAADLATARVNAAGALLGIIEDLSQNGDAVRLTEVPGTNSSTWAALSTYGDFSSDRLKSWIQPQQIPQVSGAASNGYAIRLFEGQPGAGGVEILTTDGTTGTGVNKTVGWIWDYANGILLLSDDFKASVTDLWVMGFRYTGLTVDSFLKLDASNSPLTGSLGVIGDIDVLAQNANYTLADIAFTYLGTDYHIQPVVGSYAGFYDSNISDLIWGTAPTTVTGAEDVGVMVFTVHIDIGFGAPLYATCYYLNSEYVALTTMFDAMFGPQGPATWEENYKNDTIFSNNGLGNPYTYNPDVNLTPFPGGTPDLSRGTSSVISLDQATGVTSASYFVSDVAVGTSPYQCTSTTLNSNLNAELWGSQALPALDSGKFLTNNGAALSWAAPQQFWLDGGNYIYPDTTYANHVRVSTTDQFQCRDATTYMYSSQSGYLDFVASSDGAYAFQSGATILVGAWSSYDSNIRGMNVAIPSTVPDNGAATWYEVGGNYAYYTTGWTGDSSGNRQATGTNYTLNHSTPYIVNYLNSGAYALNINSGRDWITPNTPTLATRASAFHLDVLVQDDYANGIYGFLQGQGRLMAVTQGAKINTFYGGSFGRLQIGEDSTFNTELGLGVGLEIWPMTIMNLGLLNNYKGITVTFPTMQSGARGSLTNTVGIEFMQGGNSSPTYYFTNFKGISFDNFTTFETATSRAIYIDNWANQTNAYGISIDNFDAVTNCYGIYIGSVTTGGATPSWGIYNASKTYLGGLTILTDGTIQPVSLADASAANNTIYYSTTASKLMYKDSGGGYNPLY